MTQQLYRFFDRAGCLLYIGVTLDPPARFRSHLHSKQWWETVAEVRLESYPDRESVLAAEREAIHREGPLYNVTHNPANRLPRRDVAPAMRGQRLRWRCQVCHMLIADGGGYVTIPFEDIARCEREMREWEEDSARQVGDPRSFTLSRLDALPVEAMWRIYHRRCDPHPQSADYYIDIERFSTPAHVIDWTAHLMEKTWIGYTNLPEILRLALDAMGMTGEEASA